jgi:hypothetical protein
MEDISPHYCCVVTIDTTAAEQMHHLSLPWSGDGLSVTLKCIQLKKTVEILLGSVLWKKNPPSIVLYNRTTKR